MKKPTTTLTALFLLISILFTSGCALARDNAGDGGEALPEEVEGEQEQEQQDQEKEPEAKIFYTSSYSFGEGVPVFSNFTLSDIFEDFCNIVNENDKIAVIDHQFTRRFGSRRNIPFEEADGYLMIDCIANDARLIYLMFLSSIIEQYPDNIISLDHDYDPYSSNMEPTEALFLSFDYKELGYETVIDHELALRQGEAKDTKSAYKISYYFMYVSRCYFNNEDDLCKSIFQKMKLDNITI